MSERTPFWTSARGGIAGDAAGWAPNALGPLLIAAQHSKSAQKVLFTGGPF
jgi:hypothetical protein